MTIPVKLLRVPEKAPFQMRGTAATRLGLFGCDEITWDKILAARYAILKPARWGAEATSRYIKGGLIESGG